jgi:large subunit ribosomal protein L28
MSKKCFFCGKKLSTGNSIQRKGLAKKKGGVGKKTTGISKRKFRPNLQKVRADIQGEEKRIWSCTKCIKKGKVRKPALNLSLASPVSS